MAALVYSFVRAITSISAVIFLVSAKYNMATAYIVGLVENGQYGVAIAYSSVLIVVSVVMDTINQVQSHLLAHQYEGLIEKSQLRGKRGKAGAAKPRKAPARR